MKRNYKYGKLINGRIEYAPYPLIIPVAGGNRHIYNDATAEQYSSQGYKPIIHNEVPQYDFDTEIIIERFIEDNDNIYIEYIIEYLQS